MGYLARVVSNPDVWVGDYAAVSDEQFPAAVIADVLDKKGRPLSFWAVDDTSLSATSRMVAAWFAVEGTRELTKVTLRFVPDTVPKALGIELSTSRGATLDTEFASNHRDLHVQYAHQAIGLAREMKKIDAQEVTRDQVATCFVRSAFSGNFRLDKMQHSLCKQLYDLGHLSISNKHQQS